MTRILILQGHPDADPARLCRGLAAAYRAGAEQAGHELRELDVAALALPPLRSESDWKHGSRSEVIAEAQAAIEWCEHLLVIYPMWLGDMPAALKAAFEQLLRPGFAFDAEENGGKPRLGGRSAHVVVTMGMPAFFYSWFYRAHSLKALRRNILRFVGFKPVRSTVIGLAGGNASAREHWMDRMREAGRGGR